MVRYLLVLICSQGLATAVLAEDPLKRTRAPTDWNAGRPTPKGTIARLGSPRMRSHSDYSHGLQFSPDGQLLVLAASRDDLWWFDLTTGQTLYRSEYPVGGIQCGRLLDDSSLLFFHTNAKSRENSYCITRLDPHRGITLSEQTIEVPGVDHSELNRNGTLLLVQREKRISVFNANSGEQIWSETLMERPNAPPAFLADGSQIFVCTERQLQLRDARTGRIIRELERPSASKSGSGVCGVVASADGRWIAGVIRQEQALIWDAETGKLKTPIEKQKLTIGFAPRGRLLTVAQSGLVEIWNVASGEHECEFSIPFADRASLSSDGRKLAARVHDCVVLYDVPEKGTPKLSSLTADLPGLPDELHFEPDGSLVGRLSEFGAWAIWKRREAQTALIQAKGNHTIISLNRQNDRLLSVTDKQFRIAHVNGTHAQEISYDFQRSGLKKLAALTHDAQSLIMVHESGLKHWDAKSQSDRILKSRMKGRNAGTIAAVSANSRWAATDSYDPVPNLRLVELFSLADGQSLRTIPIKGPAEILSFTPDGRRLAIAFMTTNRDGDQQKNLLVIETETGRELLRTTCTSPNSQPRLAFSPSGHTIAWVAGNEIVVYELLTGSVRSRLPVAQAGVHAVALAADGFTMAVAGPGWPVILWDLAGPSELQPASSTDHVQIWHDLLNPDSAAAYRAARRLTRAPQSAVEFLQTKLKPAAEPDHEMLAQTIANLGAPAFSTRQQASKDLRDMGELVSGNLTQALETTESAEVRQRIERLLKQLDKPNSESVRCLRAIEILEWIGTSAARGLISELARGASGSKMTQEAIRTRDRMQSYRPELR